MPKNAEGKHFSSKFRMNRHESAHGESPAAEAPEKQEGAVEGSQDVHEVAKEHGNAHEVVVKHDGEKHSVHSKHEDGHEHKSEHASAGEAHHAGACLSGACLHGNEEGDEGKGQSAGEMGEADEYAVPGLD